MLKRRTAGQPSHWVDTTYRKEKRTAARIRMLFQPFPPAQPLIRNWSWKRLLTGLERIKARYVGISATDVEDLVFLAGRVRQYSPRAIIFTISADLRFIHSDVDPDLYGTLVFSTYPLFGPNQLWTYPAIVGNGAAPHLQFPSENAEGVFNATLKLLGEPGKQLYEDGPPFTDAPDNPVLWVSVVGRDQIWPLGFHEMRPVREKASNMSASELYPAPLKSAFLLLNFGVLMICLGLIAPAFGELRPAEKSSVRYPLDWLRRLAGEGAPFEHVAGERRLRAATLTVGLLTAFVVGQGFFWLPYTSGSPLQPKPEFWVCLSLMATLLILGVVLFTLMDTHVTVWKHRRSFTKTGGFGARCRLVGSALFSYVGLILGICVAWRIWHRPGHFIVFDFLRAIHPTNGVSPLRPLMYLSAAAVALTLCQLRRLTLLEDYHIDPPFLGFEQGSAFFQGTQVLENQVLAYLSGPWLHLPGSYWFLGLSVPLCFYYLHAVGEPWESLWIDGAWFEGFYVFVSFFLYVNFSLLLLRFVWVWITLHQLLRRLYFHPTRGAYETLRMKSLPIPPKELHVRLLEPASSLTMVEYCLERTRDMLKIAEEAEVKAEKRSKDPSPIVKCMMSLRSVMIFFIRSTENSLSRIGNSTDWAESATIRADMQATMSHLSARVTTVFDKVWRLDSEGRPVAVIDEDSENSTDRKLLDQAELFIAARVVDFLRKVYPQMLNLVWFVIGGMLLMMLAASSYPFPDQDTVLWLAWAVLLAAIGASLGVFISMNISRIISMLRGTEPGRFNWDWAFTTHLVMLGVLPILAMIGAQYPQAMNNMIAWIGGIFGGGH